MWTFQPCSSGQSHRFGTIIHLKLQPLSTPAVLVSLRAITMTMFLPRDAMRKRGLCCRPVSVCPSVRLSVRHVRVLYPDDERYRQTSFSTRYSPIILVFWLQALIPNSKGNSVSGGAKCTRVGTICDFQRKSPFISETVQDRPVVTIERYGKS